MKGCLLFAGSILGGLVVGLGVGVVLRTVTGDEELSDAIGTGVWLLLVPTILLYGSFWFTDAEDIANPPRPTTTLGGWRTAKAESKLQAAEIRIGSVFALIGGATAAMAKGSNIVIAIATVCCAIIGGLIGLDVKRRVRRIRERFAVREDADGE